MSRMILPPPRGIKRTPTMVKLFDAYVPARTLFLVIAETLIIFSAMVAAVFLRFGADAELSAGLFEGDRRRGSLHDLPLLLRSLRLAGHQQPTRSCNAIDRGSRRRLPGSCRSLLPVPAPSVGTRNIPAGNHPRRFGFNRFTGTVFRLESVSAFRRFDYFAGRWTACALVGKGDTKS